MTPLKLQQLCCLGLYSLTHWVSWKNKFMEGGEGLFTTMFMKRWKNTYMYVYIFSLICMVIILFIKSISCVAQLYSEISANVISVDQILGRTKKIRPLQWNEACPPPLPLHDQPNCFLVSWLFFCCQCPVSTCLCVPVCVCVNLVIHWLTDKIMSFQIYIMDFVCG